jgi:hypothetical protein
MEPLGLLREAESVLFVDWSGQDMVGDVVRTGRTVYGHEPDGIGLHSIVEEPKSDNAKRFPLTGGGYLERGLVDPPPSQVDLVNTYRPAEEQPEIAKTAVAMGAKSFWVHPGESVSTEARELCEAAGVVFVEGVDIREVAAKL